MKYADRFSGHLDNGDTRTPCTAAGGCVWPTMPALRYRIVSDDATGVFLPLNVVGVLISKVTLGTAHDLCNYASDQVEPSPINVIGVKRYTKETEGYQWEIDFLIGSGCGLVETVTKRPLEKCNQDFVIGDYPCPLNPAVGRTGSTCRALQVEWDQTQPP